MAFTELNFVPGEIVTAAKMNLLAANDVWLKENGGKVILSSSRKEGDFIHDTHNGKKLFNLPIPQDIRGKKIMLIVNTDISDIESSNPHSVEELFLSLYTKNNKSLGSTSFRVATELNSRIVKTNNTSSGVFILDAQNTSDDLEVRITLTSYSSRNPNMYAACKFTFIAI